MRSFFVSLTILAFSLCAITVNSFAVTRSLDEALTVVSSLPEEVSEKDAPDLLPTIGFLSALWQKKLPLLELSLRTEELRECTAQITTLSGCASAGDSSGYAAALAALKPELVEMREQSSFNIKNVI